MILYPAIDLKDGQCVRLLHGDMDKVTVFNASPADQAVQFAKVGFEWLHVVDLNGAVEGRSVNSEAVQAILQAVSIPVQLGGGVRNLAAIEAWIEEGVSRVILGTVAVRDPELVRTAAVLTEILSAPERSSRRASSTVRTPPPTETGMKQTSAVRATTSRIAPRPSWLAVMSRNISSSAPAVS